VALCTASFLIVVEKMEIALFANAKKLYDHKLYECVIPAVIFDNIKYNSHMVVMRSNFYNLAGGSAENRA